MIFVVFAEYFDVLSLYGCYYCSLRLMVPLIWRHFRIDICDSHLLLLCFSFAQETSLLLACFTCDHDKLLRGEK